MLKAGITGGIGTGKTFVAGVFQKLGVPVYYSDIRAKFLIESDQNIISSLIGITGEDIYTDGKLNREKLSNYIFHDPSVREKVNSVVHPAVWKDWETWITNQKSSYVIIESALLFQTGYYKQLNTVIVVDSDEKSKIKRLVRRDGITEAEALTRINSQNFLIPSDAENISYISNIGMAEMLLPQIVEIHSKLNRR